MANKHPVQTAKHGTALVRRTRYAILKALDVVDNSDMPVHEHLAEAFKENPLKFMDTAGKYLPKQLDIDVNHSNSSKRLTDDELADIIATRARERLEAAKEIEGESEVIPLESNS